MLVLFKFYNNFVKDRGLILIIIEPGSTLVKLGTTRQNDRPLESMKIL